MEIGNSTNERCSSNDVFTVHHRRSHQINIASIADDQLVIGVRVVTLGDRTIF